MKNFFPSGQLLVRDSGKSVRILANNNERACGVAEVYRIDNAVNIKLILVIKTAMRKKRDQSNFANLLIDTFSACNKKTNIFTFFSTYQPVFTCSKSTMETAEQCEKSVQI